MNEKLKKLEHLKLSSRALEIRAKKFEGANFSGGDKQSKTGFSSLFMGSGLVSENEKEVSEKELREQEELLIALVEENDKLKTTLETLESAKKESRKNQLWRLEEEVFQIRGKYDILKNEVKKIEKDIYEKEKFLRSLVSNSFRKGFIKKQRRIRILENRLDKTIIKYNESLCIKDTYHKILKRLKRERMGFDNQLRSIERTLRAKTMEFDELKQMFHEANYLKEMSKHSLKKAKFKFEEIKKAKEKEVKEKMKYVASRLEITEKVSKRDHVRKKIEFKQTGQIGEEEEKKLHQASFIQQFSDLKNESDLQNTQNSLGNLESTWRKIKEVTGANTSKEVIEKFFSAEGTFQNLQAIAKKGSAKLVTLTEKKYRVKNQLESLKYSQSGGIGGKKIIEELNHQLGESKRILAWNKKEYETVKSGIVNLKNCCVLANGKLNTVLSITGMGKGVDDKKWEEAEELDPSFVSKIVDGLSAKLDKAGMKAFLEKQKELINAKPTLDSSNYKISSHNLRVDLKSNTKKKDDANADLYEEELDIMDRKQVKKLASLAYQKACLKAQKKGDFSGLKKMGSNK